MILSKHGPLEAFTQNIPHNYGHKLEEPEDHKVKN